MQNLKILIGVTNIILPDDDDYIHVWSNGESWYVMIDISSMEVMITD